MLKFLGIGAQKAGTTWLYEHLNQHPEIFFPGGKEIHFWDRFPTSLKDINWYRGLFSSPTMIEGDITPAYGFQSDSVVSKVAENFPDLRLIYMMRNPVERAWSSALMALRRAEMEIDETSFAWFRDHFNSRGSLARGDYESCIRTWRRHYPSSSLLLIFFEDIILAPRKTLQRCGEHIGASPYFFQDISDEVLSQRVHEGINSPIPAETRRYLKGLYAPRIRSLETYLNYDLGLWLE